MVILRKIFEISDQSYMASQQKNHARNSDSLFDSSRNDFFSRKNLYFSNLRNLKEKSLKKLKKIEFLMNELDNLKT